MINVIYDIIIYDILKLCILEIYVNVVKYGYNEYVYNKFMFIINLVLLCVDYGYFESFFEILDFFF